MTNETNLQGNQNIVIQGVTDSTITLNVNGEVREIFNKLDALQALLEKQQAQSFQTADKIYNIGSITNANFDFVVGQLNFGKALPPDLAQNLITDENRWVQSLRQELLKKGVSVGNTVPAIFQHYGWIIEVFLLKMMTKPKNADAYPPQQQLSYLAEAFQSTLRYLCYVQVAQLLRPVSTSSANRSEDKPNTAISGFIQLEENRHAGFDYLSLLLLSTEMLPQNEAFMPEIGDFVQELSHTGGDLYATALFLEKHRNLLLENAMPEEENLPRLLDEYLTGLVFWLRKLSFLAKYRLVSIKDISLNYRMGTPKNFVHRYGELHGMYAETSSEAEDYPSKSIEDFFTYNQSVLLFKGSNVASCLDHIHDPSTYLSLSPLVIDQSVFAENPKQTPEIFYFSGQGVGGRQYHFALYKNELALGKRSLPSNKELQVKAQNNRQPRLDELFEQLEQVFKPFKTPAK
ncbi:MAG: hypothetical protein K9J37_14685 [Saprospiraceae bacterium]|nr:hypothetical protein [Saprospiraceae bacterium]MCF8251154.1 hypothetical protein [Saprospiraceae bacterium]MCF8281877.1 hypothetical protein [Bacteroidales bacterium]MCF8312966.1 hypothetical protein [Saprospiraceae bacterium]MCF8441413.1 hypothetical protein [Saprospiraceae bacterium]